MDRRPLKTRSQAWVPKLAHFLIRLGLRPNDVSVLSIGFAGLSGAAFAYAPQHGSLLFLAALCIQLRLGCNLLDGVMAVEGGLKSKTGDLFNDVPDRIADAAILVGAGYGAGQPTIGWLTALFAIMTAYIRLLGGALGLAQDFCGPLAKQHRMFWMTVGALGGGIESLFASGPYPASLQLVLVWVMLGSAFTCVRRLRRIASQLEAR